MSIEVFVFKLIEAGAQAYLLWPWKEPGEFLYAMLEYGARYQIVRPYIKGPLLEFKSIMGTCGEYPHGLFFGGTPEGDCIYRHFSIQGSHYVAQHGLDGIAKALLWDEAYEHQPGVPVGGRVRIKFVVKLAKEGVFSMTLYDWQEYFVLGRNEHIRDLAINISPKED